jgi:hypothetical protein
MGIIVIAIGILCVFGVALWLMQETSKGGHQLL